MLHNFKIPTDAPRVSRSNFTDNVVLMNGDLFDDGKYRIIVPADTFSEELCQEIAELLEAKEAAEDAWNKKIETLQTLMGKIL